MVVLVLVVVDVVVEILEVVEATVVDTDVVVVVDPCSRTGPNDCDGMVPEGGYALVLNQTVEAELRNPRIPT